MPFVISYILKLSLSLAVVFLFYRFVLRKLTFYNWNRWYLLGYMLLSFLIPFIDISLVLQEQHWSQNSLVQWVPVLQQENSPVAGSPAGSAISVWSLLCLFILAGMVFLFLRILVQLVSFYRLVRKATPLQHASIAGNGMKLYQVDRDIIPFSFGNSIFINYHLHSREELREIVWHEFIHVKQKHSIDIFCAELLCLLNWYNPFAWLLRGAIRQNLEFIADNKVLENGVDRKEYQYLLLKVIGNNHFSIASKFNFSSLKKRIAMMNKMKSAGVHLVKFLFILPLVAVLLLAFRNRYERRQQSQTHSVSDTLPQKVKMPAEIASISVIDTRNDASVSDAVKQKITGMVVVKRKDGGKEVYDLDDKKSMEDFEKKYGVKLEDMVPPPPPPPVPPARNVPATPPVPPLAPVKAESVTGEPLAPVTPEAPVTTQGYNLKGISNEFEITDKKAWLKLKDGTVETYDLTSKKDKAAFEKKYGKIIEVASKVNTNINTTVASNINTNVEARIATTIAPVAVAGIPVVSVAPRTTVGYDVSETPGPSVTTAVSPSYAVTNNYSSVITGSEDIVITITRNSTRQDLDKYITEMKAKGVDLTFDHVEFNDKGVLVNLNGIMRSGDSQSNFSVSDFDSLILAMVRKGDKTYFKVSTKDSKRVI